MADEFPITLTEADNLHATRLHFWTTVRSIKAVRPYALIFVIYSAVLIWANYADGNPTNLKNILVAIAIALGGSLALMLACYGLGYLLLPRRSRKLFRQQKLLHLETVHHTTNQAICWSNDVSSVKLPYSMTEKWAENRNTFVIYLTDQSFLIFPKRVTPSEAIDAMKSNLGAAGISGRAI